MTNEGEVNQPPLQRDKFGQVDVDSVPDVIEWFLNYDQRVAIIRHPSVEEVFQWKQNHTATQGEEGLCVIAGTGSVCIGQNSNGEKAIAGGWGPLAGDEGGT